MSSLYAEDIPAGSHKIYVWEDGEYGKPIDLVVIFQPFRDGVLVSGAHGRINRKIIRELVRYAKKSGYEVMYFSRAFGGKFCRFAEYAFTDGGLVYYKLKV